MQIVMNFVRHIFHLSHGAILPYSEEKQKQIKQMKYYVALDVWGNPSRNKLNKLNITRYLDSRRTLVSRNAYQDLTSLFYFYTLWLRNTKSHHNHIIT
jgi:hypothetical protein